MEPSILESKLKPPDCRYLIARPRLLKLAASNPDAHIISINADCGYGKTTLMSQLYEKNKNPGIWQQFDERDNEIAVLLTYFHEGVIRAIPEIGGHLDTPANQLSSLEEAEKWLARMINTIDRRTKVAPVFFFDDLHCINEYDDIIKLLYFLISHPPENSRFVLASREKTKIQMGRLRAQKEIIDINTEELAFQLDETKLLLSQLIPGEVDDKVASSWHAVTEGWPIALILASRLINKEQGMSEALLTAMTDSLDGIGQYLTEELWNSLEENTRRLFIAACMLPLIEVEILDRVFKDDETIVPSGRLLQEAVEKNLMVSCIEYNRKYRFHSMFKRYLELKLHKLLTTGEIDDLCAKFAVAYEHFGKREQAIEFYLQAGNSEDAARILSDYGDSMLQAGRLTSLSAWLDRINDEIKKKYPYLLLLEARIFECKGEKFNGINKLDSARSIFRSLDDDYALCECYQIQSSLLMGMSELKAAIKAAESAITHATNEEQKVKSLNRLAVLRLLTGDTNSAMVIWDRALRTNSSPASPLGRSISLAMISGRQYQGDFRSVIRETEKEFKCDQYPDRLLERFVLAFWRSNALVNICAYEDALGFLDRVERIFSDEMKGIRSDSLSVLRGLSLIYSGEPAKGYKLIASLAESLGDNDFHGPECDYNYLGEYKRRTGLFMDAIELHQKALRLVATTNSRKYATGSALFNIGAAELRLGKDYLDDGLAHFNEAEEIARECGYKFILCKVLFYRAWLAFGNGNTEKARRAISLSLDLADKYWHHHFIVQEGRISQELLQFAFENNINRDYLVKIFSLIGSEILPMLVPLLESKDNRTKKEAMNAITAVGGIQAAPYIYPLLKDDDFEVREYAKKVAGKLRENIIDPDEVLTNRESEVLKKLSEGISNAEIAELLYITEPTVKSHITRIFQKLGVTKRTQAAFVYSQRMGKAR